MPTVDPHVHSPQSTSTVHHPPSSICSFLYLAQVINLLLRRHSCSCRTSSCQRLHPAARAQSIHPLRAARKLNWASVNYTQTIQWVFIVLLVNSKAVENTEWRTVYPVNIASVRGFCIKSVLCYSVLTNYKHTLWKCLNI